MNTSTPLKRLLAALLAVVFTSTLTSSMANDAPSHHRPGGYQNNYLEFEPKGLGELIRWRWNGWRQGFPLEAKTPTPTVAPDLAFIRANAKAASAMEPAATWIGHACVLAQLGGMNVLTDPVFSERASPVGFAGPKRYVAPAMTIAELPHIDVVLISHNHYDHLDKASVLALNAQPGGPPLFIVPLGLKAWMTDVGITNAVELDWWQQHRMGSLDVVLTPVQHWSSRSLTDRMKTLWGGYAVFAPDFHLFFAGDTAYSKDFSDIRKRFAERQGATGFDLALIPVGAYEPRWFMSSQHVNPDEAVRIHLDLAARRSMGIHWGTFSLTDEPLDAPPQELAVSRKAHGVSDADFFVTAVGETRRFERRR